MLSFHLNEEFIEGYKTRDSPFGFNGLGELVYRRTYSRKNADGSDEDWYQTVQRVVEGTYSIQKDHINAFQLGWNEEQGQQSAQEMYEKMFTMKFLPPGRGLWAMGTPIVHQKQLAAALNNCAFVSTETMSEAPTKPFEFLMDASMLGVGVGFDCKGAGTVRVPGPDASLEPETVVIPDSREGWVQSLTELLGSYFGTRVTRRPVRFDYSKIRPKGEPLRTFGGQSSGPDPLRELHERTASILEGCRGEAITSRTIVDIFNLIGKCVVSGNVRRTAEIAFGEGDDEAFLDLKNYEVNPDRQEFGWTSNNSIFARLGMDYSKISDRIQRNGEPGLCWLENMQQYGRMADAPDGRDARVRGGNPCLEQSLESYEMCCLVETFPARHSSLEEYKRTLKFAYLYAKTVTLRMTHWPETNRVMLRNRRIGCSISGVAQFLARHGIEELRQWLDEGYQTVQHWDEIYSNWFCIPRSIKTTSVKPSGTVSLLAGATPGIHYPESRFYIRRIRISKDSPLLESLRAAHYEVEDCVGCEGTTSVVSIPVDVGEGIKTLSQVPMFEQLSLAAFVQRYWADNQVSCTITFDPATEGQQIPFALDFFQYQLKGVSFLPKCEMGAYPQMPYEEISCERYEAMRACLEKVEFVDRKAAALLAIAAAASRSESPEDINASPSSARASSTLLSAGKTPISIKHNGSSSRHIAFKVNLGHGSSSEGEAEAEAEDGVDMAIFPSAVSFCTNAGCM